MTPPSALHIAATIRSAAATNTRTVVLCSTQESARRLRELAGPTPATYLWHRADGEWVNMDSGAVVPQPQVRPVVTVILDDFATISAAGWK